MITPFTEKKNFLEFFPKHVYSTLVAEKFHIYGVKITATTFVSQKVNLFIFTHAPKQNSPPSFYHYSPGKREMPIPPEQ